MKHSGYLKWGINMQKNIHYSTDVLVVGAGPTGLMAACQLALHGVSFRVIDKNTGPTTQSRALVLHARTLEIFEQMGVADKALRLGEPCHGVTWMFNGKEAVSMTIEGDDLTAFPYVLCLEQSKTEELLIDLLKTLGHTVERGTALIDYEQTADHVSAVLQTGETTENITARYVIGADGAHSIVREKMGQHLLGDTYPQALFVIDCQVEAAIRPHEIYLMMTQKGLAGFFPMVQSHDKTGNTRYRVLGVLSAEEAKKSESLTFEDLQKDFAERINMPARVHDVAWMSVYHTHHRHANLFRKDRCFIAGDAAHIHSPVGGQGMNTGLQDAYNLAWKLARVIKSQADDSLLDSYHAERIKVAENLVKTTDKVFYLAAGEKPWVKTFRLRVLPHILRVMNFFIHHIKAIGRANFRMISQIGINYRYSPLSQHASSGNFPRHAPQPGDRVPYILGIQHYLKGINYHCFVFQKGNNTVTPSCPPDTDIHIIPDTPEFAQYYRVFGMDNTSGYYLIRPDMYIAYRCIIH